MCSSCCRERLSRRVFLELEILSLVQILAQTLTDCVTFGKSLNFSVPQLLICKTGMIIIPTSYWFVIMKS